MPQQPINEDMAAKIEAAQFDKDRAAIAGSGYGELTIEPMGDRDAFVATAYKPNGNAPAFRVQAMGKTRAAAAHTLVSVVTRK